jgi:nucleoside-diphosphate-sugar epimerase
LLKVLVTGGAGFIGSHLAEALCRRGGNVVVLDNLSTGNPQNLSSIKGHFEFVEGDISDSTLIDKILPDCEWVFHQAALPSVPYSVEQPQLTHEQNLTATLNLLATSRRHEVRRLILASSCSVYGDVQSAATEDTPIHPLSPYALQKYASERYAQMFSWFKGLETVSLRYFNVFGPRQSSDSPYSGVIAKFCTQALAGTTPTILGDGKQSRDFVYVENIVEANLLAAESINAPGKVYNIGTGKNVDLIELIEELNQITGQKLRPKFAEPRSGDVRFSQGDITAARHDLGYEPKVSLREGLKRTLDSFGKIKEPLS